MALTYDPGWWRDAVVYQIYPRSFADSNGDTIGDLDGIASRVPYLAALGVDAVWLSPFYPSALADGGYDVDDYRDVDPRIGTLERFDALVAALHDAGIRIMVDIVPNHSSDRHPWFKEALAAGPGSPERDRYIFRDGKGADGSEPPSDWRAAFGGPTWTRVPDGQWYFHLFAEQQPDWNWDNPEVKDDFLRTLRFWSDRGVDGFRVDVATALAKDLTEPLPTWEELNRIPDGPDSPLYDRDEVHAIYREWRRVFNEYDPPRFAVGEVWSKRRFRYARLDELGQAFDFDLLRSDFTAEGFRHVVASDLAGAAAEGATLTWVLSNHDVVRHASRYGLPPAAPGDLEAWPPPTLARDNAWLATGGVEPPEDTELGLFRALAATQFILGLPGCVYLYQGEELGLREVATIAADERQDPTFFRSGDGDVGRDGCRVPLPWTPDGPSLGFGPGLAHLPQPAWFADHAASTQAEDPASTLTFYRRLLALRRDLLSSLKGHGAGEPDLTWLDAPANVLGFQRPNGWQVWTNFGAEAVPLPPGELLLASRETTGELPGATTVWVRA